MTRDLDASMAHAQAQDPQAENLDIPECMGRFHVLHRKNVGQQRIAESVGFIAVPTQPFSLGTISAYC